MAIYDVPVAAGKGGKDLRASLKSGGRWWSCGIHGYRARTNNKSRGAETDGYRIGDGDGWRSRGKRLSIDEDSGGEGDHCLTGDYCVWCRRDQRETVSLATHD